MISFNKLNLILFCFLFGSFVNALGVCDEAKCTSSAGYDASKCSGINKDFLIKCPCRPGYMESFDSCDFCDSKKGWTGDLIGDKLQCFACDCDANGSLGTNCTKGVCSCKDGFAGDKCNGCAPGYSSNFPNCQKCKCFPLGVVGNNTCLAQDSNTTCRCLSGYQGDDCSKCAEGYFKTTGGACNPCSCEAGNTQSAICDSNTGSCICKAGFGGDRCDQCSNALAKYPDCQGNYFKQNIEGIYAVVIILPLMAGMFFFLRRKNPEARNFLPFVALISVASLVANLLFFRDRLLSNDAILTGLTGLVIFIPMMLNLAFSLRLISQELTNNPGFRDWLSGHQVIGAVATFLATLNVELLALMSSGLAGKESFSAPIRPAVLAMMIPLFGLGKLIFGDIIMLALQVIVATKNQTEKRDLVTFLSLCFTLLLVIYGLINRTLICLIRRSSAASSPSVVVDSVEKTSS